MGIQNRLRGFITSVRVNPDSMLRVSLTIELYAKDESDLRQIVRELMNARDSKEQAIIEVDKDSSGR